MGFYTVYFSSYLEQNYFKLKKQIPTKMNKKFLMKKSAPQDSPLRDLQR